MAGLVENREAIEKIARNLVEEAGLLLIELQLKDGGSNRSILRLFVDREGGVTIPECSSLSRTLGHALEDDDIISEAYTLEVSSPGVERPFVHRIQYDWSLGKKVHVELLEKIGKKKVYEGELSGVNEDSITLEYGKGKVLEVPFDKIKEAWRMIAFGRRR